MFIRRTTLACSIVCALLVCALTGAASAGASERTWTPAPQALYYASYGASGAVIPSRFPAAAQARYYASYGHPQPLAPPPAAQPSGGTPWLALALAVAAALVVIAAGVTTAHRVRLRSRRLPGVAA